MRSWHERAQNAFSIVDKLIAQNEPLAWISWCNIGEFLWSVIDHLCPMPDCVDRSGFVHIGWEHWSQVDAPAPRDFTSRRISASIEVYLSVLRKFNSRIYGEEFPVQVQEDLQRLFSPQGWDSTGRDDWEISMVLFRVWYELFPERRVPSAADPSLIVLNERFPTNQFRRSIVSEDAQHAFFSGSFAVMMQLAKRRRESPVYHAKEFIEDELQLAILLPVVQWETESTDRGAQTEHNGAVFYICPE
jgi:hypothetical protein